MVIEDDLDEYFVGSSEFPGIAPEQSSCAATAVEIYGDSTAGPPLKIGLVSVARPADAIGLLGWNGTEGAIEHTAELVAVLRSWEDRFGVLLLTLAPNGFELLVERPPKSDDDRPRWYAELATIDEFGPFKSETYVDYLESAGRMDPEPGSFIHRSGG